MTRQLYTQLCERLDDSIVERSDPGQSAAMANPDRLTGLDASFLALEDAGRAHARRLLPAVRGQGAGLRRLRRAARLAPAPGPALPPEARVPAATQARPVWIDDPHFNPGYHVRHTALPGPRASSSCATWRAGVRAAPGPPKPLWEIWLVDRVEDGRFAMITKTHHCLVDGVSGVDIATVLFDAEPDPRPPPEPPRPWYPSPSRARRRSSPTRSPSARQRPARRRAPRRRRGRAPRQGPAGSARPS